MSHPLVREALNVFVVLFLVFLLTVLVSCIQPHNQTCVILKRTFPNTCIPAGFFATNFAFIQRCLVIGGKGGKYAKSNSHLFKDIFILD